MSAVPFSGEEVLQAVGMESDGALDEVMARGFFVALPLSYSEHFG